MTATSSAYGRARACSRPRAVPAVLNALLTAGPEACRYFAFDVHQERLFSVHQSSPLGRSASVRQLVNLHQAYAAAAGEAGHLRRITSRLEGHDHGGVAP